jgi:choline dehydrogenase
VISGINRETVDFVIVGAGSAGCTLYHQLSQIYPGSFVLIEAGVSPAKHETSSTSHHTPVHYPKLFRSNLDWNYQTQPQEFLGNRKVHWPRGKGLGGSSLINAMIYLPGSAGDWNALANSWSIASDELRQHLPHQIPTALWPSATEPEIHPLSRTFLEACQQKLQQPPCDFLADADYTFNAFPRSTFRGRRVNAYQAFVSVKATAKQVSVVTDSVVQQILFEGNRAVAVLCYRQGKPHLYIANQAIILCAGAVESPAILMRSGIGDPHELSSHGISVIQDLPGVGRNLQDHLLMPLIVASKRSSLTNKPTLEEQQSYRWSGHGPQASNIAEAGCFFEFNAQHIPQLQVHFTPTHYLEYPLRDAPTGAFTLGLTLLQPHSRGSIRLTSTNPLDPPRIDPSYLSAPKDLAVLVDGFQFIRELASTVPLSFCSSEEILPGEKRGTGPALERAIRAFVQTVFHPAGTCAVGTNGESVVDTNFLVHGMKALFVVDASVFDRIPACNPAAQVMALASVAAQRIHATLR